MKSKYCLALSLVSIGLFCEGAFAIGTRKIPANIAKNGVNLKVMQGYGIILNTSSMNEEIATVYLSDPSQITLSSNLGGCQQNGCQGGSVFFLRAIDELQFDGLPRAVDKAALLSVITKQGSVLQFRLTVASAVPSYTHIEITPDLPKPNPFLDLPPQQNPQASIIPVPSVLPVVRDAAPVEQINISAPILSLPNAKEQVETSATSLPNEPVATQIEPDQPARTILPKAVQLPEPKGDSRRSQIRPRKTEASQQEAKAIATLVKPTSAKLARPATSNQDIFAASNQAIAEALLKGINSEQGRREIGNSIHRARSQDVMFLLKQHEEMPLKDALILARMDQTVAHNLIRYGAKQMRGYQ